MNHNTGRNPSAYIGRLRRLLPLLLLCLICFAAVADDTVGMKMLLQEGEKRYEANDYSGAIRKFLELSSMAEKAKDLNMMCHAQYNLGVAYLGICETGSAMVHLNKAFELLSQGEKNHKREVEILSCIGGVYFMQEDYANAYRQLETASKLASQYNDTVMEGMILLNMALIANKQFDFEKSERLMEEGRSLSFLPQRQRARLKEVEAESFILRKQWARADSLARAVLDSKDSSYVDKGLMYTYLMECANRRKTPYEAIAIADKCFGIVTLQHKPYYYYQLAEAYRMSGDYERALVARDSLGAFKDSLDNINSRRIVEDGRIALEVKSYQLEIDKKLAKNKEHTVIAVSLSLISLLLLVMAGIIIYYQRQKNKEHRKTLQLQIAKEQSEREMAEERMKETELLSEMQEEILRKEIEHKNMEIKANAMFISSRKGLLEEILEYLDTYKESPASQEIQSLRQHLSRMLHNEGMDRKEFMNNFDAIDQDFNRKMLERHPTLLQSDLKFLSLIKMNMSMKEIAAVLNINPDSSKRRKIRLSKKLGLSSSSELYSYLLTI